VAGGQILGFSIDLLRRPYNTLALPCECVIILTIWIQKGYWYHLVSTVELKGKEIDGDSGKDGWVLYQDRHDAARGSWNTRSKKLENC